MYIRLGLVEVWRNIGYLLDYVKIPFDLFFYAFLIGESMVARAWLLELLHMRC